MVPRRGDEYRRRGDGWKKRQEGRDSHRMCGNYPKTKIGGSALIYCNQEICSLYSIFKTLRVLNDLILNIFLFQDVFAKTSNEGKIFIYLQHTIR